MKRLLRWPVLVILAVLVLAACFPAILSVVHATKTSAAHAAGNNTPSISLPDVIHPYDVVTVTAHGFLPDDHVYLSVPNFSNPFSNIPCDGSGNCSGTVTIPPLGIQGMVQVTGSNEGGLSAQVTVTALPGIYLSSPNQYSRLKDGGPGTAISVNGATFTAYETVAIYWDTTQEGTTATDYNGNLSYTFSAPDNVTPGSYPVIIKRSNQSPSSVETTFTILAPAMKASAGIRNSQPVHVKLSGFQAGEQVTISWNANNGQVMTTLTMDDTGAIDTYFVPPFAPRGSYVMTATGNSSKLQATSSLNIGPGILLDPNTTNPGGTFTVEGGGYTPGETVNVYFQNTGNGVVQATVDTSGSFSVSLTAPVTYDKHTQYYVYASSTNGADHAKAQFFYAVPSLKLTQGLSYGESFTVAGQGFAANDTVDVFWQAFNQKNLTKLGTVTAASDGAFSFTSTALSAPYESFYENTYNVVIIAKGHIDGAKANLDCYEYANIIAVPTAGPIGSKVHLSGGGFGSQEMVTISLDGIQVAILMAKGDGGFATTFKVPENAPIGGNSYSLEAVGSTSGLHITTLFIVTPTLKISPDTGPSGTAITVVGKHCTYSTLVYIYWYYPDTKTQVLLTSVTTSPTGTFTTQITAPANLKSGETYDVLLVDDYVNTEAPFVAQ